MALSSDILKVFNAMPATQYTAADGTTFSNIKDLVDYSVKNKLTGSVSTNAKDDKYMCDNIASAIKTCCSNVILTVTVLAGPVSGATVVSGTGVTTGWDIDDGSLSSSLLSACSAQDNNAIATQWGTAIGTALMGGQGSFDSIIGTGTTTSSPPTPYTGTGKGTATYLSATNTLIADIQTAFNITVDSQGIASGDDSAIATQIATSVLKFLNSMQVTIIAGGALSGASGTGMASGAA